MKIFTYYDNYVHDTILVSMQSVLTNMVFLTKPTLVIISKITIPKQIITDLKRVFIVEIQYPLNIIIRKAGSTEFLMHPYALDIIEANNLCDRLWIDSSLILTSNLSITEYTNTNLFFKNNLGSLSPQLFFLKEGQAFPQVTAILRTIDLTSVASFSAFSSLIANNFLIEKVLYPYKYIISGSSLTNTEFINSTDLQLSNFLGIHVVNAVGSLYTTLTYQLHTKYKFKSTSKKIIEIISKKATSLTYNKTKKVSGEPLECIILRDSIDNPFRQVKIMIDEIYGNNQVFNNYLVILGYNVGPSIAAIRLQYPNKIIVLYQLEQLFNYLSLWYNPQDPRAFVRERTKHVHEWLTMADEVWDYDLDNIKFLKKLNIDAIFKPMKYTNSLKRITHSNNKEIDVLFYGAINERRAKLLQKLAKHVTLRIIGDYSLLRPDQIKEYGLDKIIIKNTVFGKQLDDLIAKSKIILSSHYYPGALQEQVRIFDLIINDCCVVSENSIKNYFGELIIEFSDETDAIVKIIKLLANDSWKEHTFNLSKKFKIGNFKKYKVGAIYNTFYGLNMLKESIESIRGVVDHIVVVHQRVSFAGQQEDPTNDEVFEFLLNHNYIDEIIYYDRQPGIDTMVGVITKRNLGLDNCKNNDCNYILTMDTDECYNHTELLSEINRMSIENLQTLYSPIYAYYYNEQYYFVDSYYVPSIYKVDTRKYIIGATSNVLCDPVRKLQEGRYSISTMPMHHLTYLTKNFDDKQTSKLLTDTDKSDFIKIKKYLKTWKPGEKALVFTNNMNNGGELELALIDLIKITTDLY